MCERCVRASYQMFVLWCSGNKHGSLMNCWYFSWIAIKLTQHPQVRLDMVSRSRFRHQLPSLTECFLHLITHPQGQSCCVLSYVVCWTLAVGVNVYGVVDKRRILIDFFCDVIMRWGWPTPWGWHDWWNGFATGVARTCNCSPNLQQITISYKTSRVYKHIKSGHFHASNSPHSAIFCPLCLNLNLQNFSILT